MLSICVISNQPHAMMGFVSSIEKDSMLNAIPKIELCLSYQFSDYIVENGIKPICENKGIKLVSAPTPSPHRDSDGRFNYARSRAHSVSMASQPFIMLADSDFEFQSHAGKMNYSSGDRIMDAIQLLQSNPEVGIVRLSSAFGGSHLGRSFIEFKSSCASTDRGLILRNSEVHPLIEPEFLVAGVGEDVAIILSKFIQGFNAMKGFNSITNRPVCKHFGKGYDIELERGGLLGTIDGLYPRFTIDTKFGRKRLHPKEWEQIFNEK